MVVGGAGVKIPDLTARGGDCDGDGSTGMGVGGEECCRVVAIDGNLVSSKRFHAPSTQ